MPEQSLDTLPLVDNSGGEAKPTSAPAQVVAGQTGQSPQSTRRLSQEPGVIDQTKLDDDGSEELSIDDPDSVYKDESTPKSNESSKDTTKKQSVVKPKVEDKETPKDDVELKDQGFDLGEESEDEEKPTAPPKKGRDYSGFKPEQVEILKHIPNYLFDKAKQFVKSYDDVVKERDTLKGEVEKVKSGRLPESYYEHEKAYLLHPDYEKLQQTQGFIDFEENHYTEQLENIETGKEWLELKGYNKGEPVFEKHPALGEDKVDIRAKIWANKYLSNLQNKRNETQQKLGSLTNEFKNNSATTKQSYDEVEEKFFSKLKDMTKLPKEAQNYYNQALQYLKSKFPVYADHKFLDWFAKSALSNIYKTQQLTKFQNRIKELEGKKKDELEVGPTSKDLSGTPSGSGKTEVVYDMNNMDKDF